MARKRRIRHDERDGRDERLMPLRGYRGKPVLPGERIDPPRTAAADVPFEQIREPYPEDGP